MSVDILVSTIEASFLRKWTRSRSAVNLVSAVVNVVLRLIVHIVVALSCATLLFTCNATWQPLGFMWQKRVDYATFLHSWRNSISLITSLTTRETISIVPNFSHTNRQKHLDDVSKPGLELLHGQARTKLGVFWTGGFQAPIERQTFEITGENTWYARHCTGKTKTRKRNGMSNTQMTRRKLSL